MHQPVKRALAEKFCRSLEHGPPRMTDILCVGSRDLGKSTILHTIAKQCDDEGRLAFSFFFSRGKADRSDPAKVIPTFAYQLAKSLPAIQQPLLHVLIKENPFAPHLRLHHQLKNLIIDPAHEIKQTILPMVVIMDGLDECSDEDLLLQLIHLLS